MSNDTPRTDQAEILSDNNELCHFPTFARTLERELAACEAERDALRAALEFAVACHDEKIVEAGQQINGWKQARAALNHRKQ